MTQMTANQPEAAMKRSFTTGVLTAVLAGVLLVLPATAAQQPSGPPAGQSTVPGHPDQTAPGAGQEQDGTEVTAWAIGFIEGPEAGRNCDKMAEANG